MTRSIEERTGTNRTEIDKLNTMVDKALSGAKIIATRYNLPQTIGITDGVDSALFSHFLAERLLRTSSDPATGYLSGLPTFYATAIASPEDDERKQEVQNKVKERTGKLILENYPDSTASRFVRTIELAVHNLVSSSIKKYRDKEIVMLGKRKLNDWGNQWRPQLASLQGQTR